MEPNETPHAEQVAMRPQGNPANGDAREPMILVAIANGSKIDRVIGIDIGRGGPAMRPSSLSELLRRTDADAVAAAVSQLVAATPSPRRRHVIGSLVVDVDEHRVLVGRREVHLTVMEFRLLAYLVDHRDRLCPREEILKSVWGERWRMSKRTLDTHVTRVRDKIAGARVALETVRGIGLRLVEEGEEESEEEGEKQGEHGTADSPVAPAPRPHPSKIVA